MTEVAADQPDFVDEERENVEGAIAEQIAQLSESNETPTEFDPPGRALSSTEVDFRSAAWMTALAEVQGWLRLPEELQLTTEDEFLRGLIRGLEVGDENASVERVDGRVRLTTLALDRLNSRL